MPDRRWPDGAAIAARYLPSHLMILWNESLNRLLKRPHLRFVDTFASKQRLHFVKAQRFFIEQAIDPRRYFRALFEYAIEKQGRLAPTARSYVSMKGGLWRPFASLLTHELYLSIYQQWERRQVGLAAGKEDGAAKLYTARHDQTPERQFQESLRAYHELPQLYPSFKLSDILTVIFHELSPYFLYVCPEAKQLIALGYGTPDQKRTFEKLDRDRALRQKFQQLYDTDRETTDGARGVKWPRRPGLSV